MSINQNEKQYEEVSLKENVSLMQNRYTPTLKMIGERIMDIIECLIKLGSGVVSSMLETSKRYSNDERFTPEGREYYRELHEGLSIASNNLQDYQEKRKSSAFEKLDTDVSPKIKLDSCQNNVNALKARVLIESYFGVYRGKYPFYFFGENEFESSDLHYKILQYLKYPYGEGKEEFHLTPILALSSCTTESASCLNTMVFCEEGIAFDYCHEFRVVPYETVKIVYKKKKRSLLGSTWDVFLLSYNEEPLTHYVLGDEYSAGINLTHCNERDREMFARSIYDFIQCFNRECKYSQN